MTNLLSAISVQCVTAAVVEYIYCPTAQRMVPRAAAQHAGAANTKACFRLGAN